MTESKYVYSIVELNYLNTRHNEIMNVGNINYKK